jgi:hypothetical protein
MAAGIDAKEAARCVAFSPQGVRLVHHHEARGYLRPVVSGHAEAAISQHPAAVQITMSKRTIDVATRWFAPERVSAPTG